MNLTGFKKVLDVTKFLEEHPGGEEVLIESAGKDASKDFDDIGHSKAAKSLLLKYQVGVLEGYKVQKDEDRDVPLKESKNKEMSAFVIKDEPVPKYAAFVEFFVPLLVAGSYFGYRFLTRVIEGAFWGLSHHVITPTILLCINSLLRSVLFQSVPLKVYG